MPQQPDTEFLKDTTAKLAQARPGAQLPGLSELVSIHTRLGRVAAIAAAAADEAEAIRKREEAKAYLEAKASADKVTSEQANAMAAVNTWSFKETELSARAHARKVQCLLDSSVEAINAVKFLGRTSEAGPVKLPEMPF